MTDATGQFQLTDDDAVLEKVIQYHADIQASSFSQAVAYNNIVVAAGYAGSFALWNIVRGQLTATTSNWIVVTLGISLVTYISWVVFNMIWTVLETSTYDETVRGKTGEEWIRAYRAAGRAIKRRHHKIFARVWINQLVVTVVTAAIGMGILLWNAAEHLLV